MGVDYNANFGIGFKVNIPDCEDVYEKLKEIPEGYGYFLVGDGSYTGKEDDIYIVIKDIFKDGYEGIEQKGEILRKAISDMGIEVEGKLDIVGGLRIW